ncbi:MAG: bifunctional precorrin-2 dehydrogenase/sirohydrochlorin ferrochelatase [Bacteroidia bacterium]|nr:bifunctional precorrin-2 dehydrogenase/sirohydrochlorin ferrochelatase [Bacteroidia bacterium]
MTQNNLLYPIFLKLDKVRMLIVGAGEVGFEKLHFILKSSPNASITVVATWVSEDVHDLLVNGNYDIRVLIKNFETEDIQDHDLVVAATNDQLLNAQIHAAAKQMNKIVNVADTPELCDFYMGSIVTRGDLKVAISTNGKSPTFAKRFRQLLEEVLPNDTKDLINNLKQNRDGLKVGFSEKVKKLNEITASLVD